MVCQRGNAIHLFCHYADATVFFSSIACGWRGGNYCNDVGDVDVAKLNCKITDIKRVSPYGFAYLAGLEFDDGEKTWRKAYKFDFGHVPSLDEFKEQLRFVDPNPDVDTEKQLLESAIGQSIEIDFVPQRQN